MCIRDRYSDILYITLTQDIHSVACAFSKKKAVNKEKAYFVINRYDDKCKLKLKDIAEWIESVSYTHLDVYKRQILQDALKSEGLNVVGVVTYKSGILKKIEETRPDVVVIRENILGNENILDIIFEIRTQYPAVRVVFFAETEEDGNNMIATLVSYGIYDILSGKKLKLAAMVNIIKTPRTLKDIGKFNICLLYTSNAKRQ